ncbi:3-keto-disaccharide hydrolase [Horticoccus sp. 23ND18S-11]
MLFPSPAAELWRDLFNGRDLGGWKANAYPDSWSVVDGAIRACAIKESSHLFFVGSRSDGHEALKDFELEVVARSEPNSNGGIFIHTDTSTQSAALRLSKGYEIQLNSSAKEKRKTGSLYAVVDLPVSPVDETNWFTTLITVRGQHITVQLDGKLVVDYTEPALVQRPPERAGRRLNPAGGALALQAHDPGSTFYFKSIRIRTLSPD